MLEFILFITLCPGYPERGLLLLNELICTLAPPMLILEFYYNLCIEYLCFRAGRSAGSTTR